jgi:hypothetical protein
MTWDQNVVAWLSPASSESHAGDGASSAASDNHSASNVVLPKPAGAETNMSFRSAARASRSVSRGRATWPRRSLGM